MFHLILCVFGVWGDFFGRKHHFPSKTRPDRGEEYVCGVGVSPTDQDEDHLTGHTGCLSRLLMVAWELKNLPRRCGEENLLVKHRIGELGEAVLFLQTVIC